MRADRIKFTVGGKPAMRGNYRVRGNVVPGTIVKRAGELGAEFEMTDGTHAIRVRYLQEVPDTFVDHAEVVVEGEMGPDQVFLAHTLLAKCPSKYEVGSEATDPA